MPKFSVRCVDRETGVEYVESVDASTEANARIHVANSGHMLVGGLDKAPPPPVRDAGVETVHLLREILDEQRRTIAYLEKRMLTQWRLIFALYGVVLVPVALFVIAAILAGGIDQLINRR